MKAVSVIFASVAGVAALAATTLSAAPAPNGQQLFQQRCQGCHTVIPNKPGPIGPSLAGVVGRKAGTSAFSNYSPALKASGVTWTKVNLDKFLTAPTRMVPGTRMVITVSNPAQRTALIAFLATKR